MPQYTPTEQRILDILSDGQPHFKTDFIQCFNDQEQANPTALSHYVSRVRKKVQTTGRDIVSVIKNRRCYYRMVIPITTDDTSTG